MTNPVLAAIARGASGVAISVSFLGVATAQDKTFDATTYEQLDLFGDIFETVRSTYVDDVEDIELIRSAIDGMLSALDPHSGFLPPEDFEKMQIQSKGEFGGVGIEVTQENGILKVVSPIDGTPAAKAGLEAGDLIIQVDGTPTLGQTLNEVVETLRGPVGKEVTVTISREGEEKPFDVLIVRDIIKIRAVRSRVIGDSIVIRVASFTEQTFDNLTEDIEKQVEAVGGLDELEGFIIDLRNNPGGLLDQAVKMSDAFLERGEIVSTRGRVLGDGHRYNASPGDLADGKPIVVLINRGSASASEIVAGALQDHHRAVIVGTKSFGKGSVQTVLPLNENGAIRLTTARYYTPSGHSIQGLGIYPDVFVEQRPAVEPTEDDEIADRFMRTESSLPGSLTNENLGDDVQEMLDKEVERQQELAEIRNNDFQLGYALDVLHGLSVFATP
ncbi:MAG: S41 family peptidase [Paracoccaceae bacterium]|nr:S41 family peptidase [Paracoccaceae bacterium]